MLHKNKACVKHMPLVINSNMSNLFQVLRCFISGQETENIILVEALRQFLQSFRLPGEAQQVRLA